MGVSRVKLQMNRISGISTAGEIKLFETMQVLLNQNGKKAVFCQKVHKHYVEFYDGNRFKTRREIADLLIVSLDYKTKRVRISFLQAKRHKGSVLNPPVYRFKGEPGQFFLLKYRPNLISGYPPRTLNFSSARSLTTYGVFYNDVNKNIEFLYSAANYLVKRGKKNKGSLELNTNIMGNLPKSDQYTFEGCVFNESTAIDGIDLFEKNLITWNIGAVLPSSLQKTILQDLFQVGWDMLSGNPFYGYYENGSTFEEKQAMLNSLAVDFDIQIRNEERQDIVGLPCSSILFVECNSDEQTNLNNI